MAIRRKLITQEDAATLTGRSRRSITTWIKEGMRTYPTARNGRHVVLVDEAEVLRWADVKSNNKNGKKATVRRHDADNPPPTADLDQVLANLEQLNPDQIEATMDRVSRLEQALYQVAFSTMNTELIRAYKDVLAARRQIEKELPEILARKGRYVDAELVGQVVAEAMHGVSATLDTIGSNAAPLCAGKGVREIRRVIDTHTAKAKAHIRELLNGEVSK